MNERNKHNMNDNKEIKEMMKELKKEMVRDIKSCCLIYKI